MLDYLIGPVFGSLSLEETNNKSQVAKQLCSKDCWRGSPGILFGCNLRLAQEDQCTD